MSSNAFNQLDREYTEREDYLANRAEERKTVDPQKITLTQFKIILEKFMLARGRYMNSPTSATTKAWKAADLELANAYNKYMETRK
jgi:hypothetical protein